MAIYDALYEQAKQNLSNLRLGEFRFADICNNPPALLGRRFYEDVINGVYPNVIHKGSDKISEIYEKIEAPEKESDNK